MPGIEAELPALEPGELGRLLATLCSATTRIGDLKRRGHQVRQLDDTYGNMQAILWDRRSGEVTAASDPRGIGSTALIPHPPVPAMRQIAGGTRLRAERYPP